MNEQQDNSKEKQAEIRLSNSDGVRASAANPNGLHQTCPPRKRSCLKTERGAHLIFACVVAVFTVILAYVSYGQWQAMEYSNQINRDAMIASTRAWLTPSSVTLTSPIQAGVPLSINVSFGNIGKEPALGFVAKEELGFIDAPKTASTSWYTVFQKSFLFNICANTNASDGGNTFYPSGLREYSYGLSTNTATPVEMIGNTRIIYIHGCFAYKTPVTIDMVHKSEYCFMLVPDKNGGFKSVSCPFGNNAD